jgi:16S rRNA (guanine527-N7)-methyltransferase
VERLLRRAAACGVRLDEAQAARTWIYFQLLSKWNARVNLTGLRLTADNDQAIDRLLVEPIVAAVLAGSVGHILDVGSGGGSPAIPLAISVTPSPALTMVESRVRKSVFLREALLAVRLKGEVRTERFEKFAPTHPRGFDLVSVRAVRMDPGLLEAMTLTLAPKGRVFWFHEAGQLPSDSAQLRWEPPQLLVPSLKSVLSVGHRI